MSILYKITPISPDGFELSPITFQHIYSKKYFINFYLNLNPKNKIVESLLEIDSRSNKIEKNFKLISPVGFNLDVVV